MDLPDSTVTTALEARLNEARRVKRGQELRRERKLFLTRLTLEREERVLLEAGAAAKIQALFRGFLARPRPPRTRPRQALTLAESNRRLVADLQAILSRAGLPTIPGLGPDGRKAVEGSDWGQGRGVEARRGGETQGNSGSEAGGRPSRRGSKGSRRSRSRKFRAFEDDMATRISKVIRGFLERRRFERRWAAWDEERRWAGASCLQRAWRSYHKRMGWHHLESGVMDRAATKVQARWRGMACRMALTHRREEDALWKRKTVSAVTIQTAARRRCMMARYAPKLTLRAARRQREAREAAEAARPRRRRNRGGPSGAAGDGLAGASSRSSISPRTSIFMPTLGAKGFRAERGGPRQSVVGTAWAVGVGWNQGGPGGAAGAAAAAAAAIAAASPRVSIFAPASGAKWVRAGRDGPRPSDAGRTKDFGVEDSVSVVGAAGEGLDRKEGGMAEVPPEQAGARPAQPKLDPSAAREARKDSGGAGVNGRICISKSRGLPGLEGQLTGGGKEAVTISSPSSRKEEHAGGNKRESRGTEACRGQEHRGSPAGDFVPASGRNNTHAKATDAALTAAADTASGRSRLSNPTKDSGTEAKVAGVRFAPEAGESSSEIGRRACGSVSLLFVEDSVETAVARRAREASAQGSTACIPGALDGAAAAVGMFPSASPLPDNVRGGGAVAVTADL